MTTTKLPIPDVAPYGKNAWPLADGRTLGDTSPIALTTGKAVLSVSMTESDRQGF